MAAAINFVRQRLRKLTKTEKKDKATFRIAATITAILLAILIAILSYKLYLVS